MELKLSSSEVTEPSGNERHSVSVLDHYREELVEYLREMQEFNHWDPSKVFQSLSAYSARAMEMRQYLTHYDSRRNQAFRKEVVDAFISECERQFKFQSRAQAVREMDARLAGGHFA